MLQPNAPAATRLLVLDEDRIILSSLSQFLLREGYEVKTTASVGEAIARLETEEPKGSGVIRPSRGKTRITSPAPPPPAHR